jgi:hypothetical protein
MTTSFGIASNSAYRHHERNVRRYDHWPVLHVRRPSEAGIALLELGAAVVEAIEEESSPERERDRESVVSDRAEAALRIELDRAKGRRDFLELLRKAS